MKTFKQILTEGKKMTVEIPMAVKGTDVNDKGAIDKAIGNFIKKNMKGIKISWKTIDYDGPGGGVPEIRVTGSEEDIRKFMDEYGEDIQDYLV